ncbi:MAG TPA: 16S rRNA (adenine(1518)-N(6)/adenine(1519)-N(6))-dimethyltransferase RsmA [Candidatus Dormibacteraeota bacterium]|nr:16S rRNA (adenine(1518)-N(6)/adenine(1519)-N(6))-dimethyltransferase RsmA [Candidatus Dormibacteraeota bacterium]
MDLADLDTALATARRAGVALRHDLGQHLLVDRRVLDTILDALDIGPSDGVLEVGPGIGTLTVELAARARRVVAVELDPACARATRRSLAAAGGRASVEVVEGDALGFDPGAAGLDDGWLAAGNIPYSITGALLEHILGAPVPPRRAVFLVQREVARRLAAPSGDWSLATVVVRTLATAERLDDVPPAAFAPPPRVWSSVLRLSPARTFAADERQRVVDVARACFQLRRKVLRHGVARACGGDEAAASAALSEAGIDTRRRPGELDLDEWRRLAAAVSGARR